MNIIFLDIDGVLNAEDDFGGRKKPNPKIEGYRGISKVKVRMLKEIVDITKAEIVLVSSWKENYEDYINNGYKNKIGKYLYNKLRELNLEIKETTLKYNSSNNTKYREKEIKNYLKDHPEVENYVIIDDEAYVYSDKTILKHLVVTYEDSGLNIFMAAKAIYKLNGVKTETYKNYELFRDFFQKTLDTVLPELIPQIKEVNYSINNLASDEE